jgi:hypothetical protein
MFTATATPWNQRRALPRDALMLVALGISHYRQVVCYQFSLAGSDRIGSNLHT